jgi:capsular exopolysaccharide synthesis family protein
MRLVAVESGRDTMTGCVDEKLRLAEPLVSFLAPVSLEADQYRTLRQLVEHRRSDSACQVLAVTSAAAGEGKTVTALNLAGALAQSSNSRVLIIDADLHRPAVAEYLGLSDRRGPGLAEAILHEEFGLPQAVRRLDSLNVSVLLAGDGKLGPYELLASPRLEKLLRDARAFYDYVIIDTPPVVPLVDCRLLGRLVDGFIVVVAAHKTPRKLVAEAMNLLDGTKLLGVVFNGDDRPLAAYYGYYGYSQPSGNRSSWWRRALSMFSA